MKLSGDPKQFQVPVAGKKAKPLSLARLPTSIDKLYKNKKDYLGLMKDFTEELQSLQRVLYAHGRYAVLMIFQGMDTAGKDGAIRHVMRGVNPQGCSVHSFKQPSAEDLAHDYLWRTAKRLPMRGKLGIFNRSYYEEVLIVKAVPSVLNAQLLPDGYAEQPGFWPDRYRDIVSFENYLHRNGTRILKFFLHLSKGEQRKRLLARADEPEKNWKISADDLKSRAQWDDFQTVYGECLQHTSHALAPWYAIPADDKRNARLILSRIIVETLRSLPLAYPKPDAKQRAEVRRVREVLRTET